MTRKPNPGQRLFAALFAWALTASAAGAAEARHKVIWQTVRDQGLVATYLRPKGDEKRPAIVVVGGSEGGLKSAERLAYRFSEYGWAALAVAYFGAENLPKTLANIPLEYFDTAAIWLARQPRVDAKTLSIAGASRGGELALLVAAHNPAFTRVVAWVPSHVVWGPVGAGHERSVSAWTRAGRPLPFVSHRREPDYTREPYHGTPDFLSSLRQTEMAQAAAIPVENIRGAVLLLSGEDDRVWPSAVMSRLVIQRLETARHPYRFEHHAFPGAGHLIMPGADPGMTQAKHPVGLVIAFGGNKSANRFAQESGWAKALEFLRADIRPAASLSSTR